MLDRLAVLLLSYDRHYPLQDWQDTWEHFWEEALSVFHPTEKEEVLRVRRHCENQSLKFNRQQQEFQSTRFRILHDNSYGASA